ncbi:carboxy-cis,cis-muconate cyclase [Pleomassaria siparia CBS 279.74]|uniref:Carboxy-cis,cis-muconate cyclase n=1 Tax=Pleomassaria siparia CBS 279.74 TaxID=1314801 RepID=A0A6G1JTZ3_9PLEO|nr:carboxy-cis,cis-muconate cyclase [Pleomassaria siparia CBS 279.74]
MFPTRTSTLASLFVVANVASATVHHLFVGTYVTSDLYTLAFDDEALTLEIVQNSTASTGHSWIAFDHTKSNVYGNAGTAVSSYSVLDDTRLHLDATIPVGGNCSNDSVIYIAAAKVAPYDVYSVPYGNSSQCGTVLSTFSNGTISSVAQVYPYLATSGVHGLAFSPDGKFLYSADDIGNSVWTHSVDATTGELTYVDRAEAPVTGADPRHAAVHSSGSYLYVGYEGPSQIAVYNIDTTTGIPTFTNITYSLIPEDVDHSLYWSDEVLLSFSESYLWATARGKSTNVTGYITALTLDTAGAITEQLFITPTTTSGGPANVIAPADFSDKWAAMSDGLAGTVEIRVLDAENKTADIVAKVTISAGGRITNPIWYD